MSELLPCPFCGGEAKVAIGQGQHDGHGYIVFCDRCWVSQSYLDKTEAEAIAAWNNRAERTCKFTIEDNMNETEGMGDVWIECSTCNCVFDFYADEWLMKMSYCPNCGARRVGE